MIRSLSSCHRRRNLRYCRRDSSRRLSDFLNFSRIYRTQDPPMRISGRDLLGRPPCIECERLWRSHRKLLLRCWHSRHICHIPSLRSHGQVPWQFSHLVCNLGRHCILIDQRPIDYPPCVFCRLWWKRSFQGLYCRQIRIWRGLLSFCCRTSLRLSIG